MAWARFSLDIGDRLLDAEIDHLVAVVGEDDVDEVLADVVHVPLDRGQDDNAFLLPLDFFHMGFEMGDCGFHGFRTL